MQADAPAIDMRTRDQIRRPKQPQPYPTQFEKKNPIHKKTGNLAPQHYFYLLHKVRWEPCGDTTGERPEHGMTAENDTCQVSPAEGGKRGRERAS